MSAISCFVFWLMTLNLVDFVVPSLEYEAGRILDTNSKDQMDTAGSTNSERLISLDQYRGYTVLGMFFVNFAGNFAITPAIFKHHNTYCSYADTIMPQFFFAVGFAYRLTLLKRLKTTGPSKAYRHVIWRNLGLILLGFVIYHLDKRASSWEAWQVFVREHLAGQLLKREIFQTLVHIAVASFWVLPVITASPAVRIAFACFSGILHLGLSYWFYYDWVHADPAGIDGGPLGFLTWTIPLLTGSLAYDVVVSHRSLGTKFLQMACGGIILMMMGYGLSCLSIAPRQSKSPIDTISFRWVEPPFVPPATGPGNELVHKSTLLTMSQRAGSISYLTFTAGFSLAMYALFFLVCDVGQWQLGIFGTLGSNALAGYVLHELVGNAVEAYAPADSPLWYTACAIFLYLTICYLFLRHLQRHKLFLRL
jgi:predicted acyltransferase